MQISKLGRFLYPAQQLRVRQEIFLIIAKVEVTANPHQSQYGREDYCHGQIVVTIAHYLSRVVVQDEEDNHRNRGDHGEHCQPPPLDEQTSR